MAVVQSLRENDFAKVSVTSLKEPNVDQQQGEVTLKVRFIKEEGNPMKIIISNFRDWKILGEWEKFENDEIAVRLGEALLIAYLNKTSVDINDPEVSQKDFDAVIKENSTLKQVLKRIVLTKLGGKDIIDEEREEMQKAIDDFQKIVSDLTNELAQINESKVKTEVELSETKKKCNGFYHQVVGLHEKQHESDVEISSLKKTVDSLRAQVAEKKAMMVMTRDAVRPTLGPNVA